MLIHWLGPYAPVPGRSGADLRSYHLLRELSRRCTVKGWFLGAHGDDVEPFLDEYHQLEAGDCASLGWAGILRLQGVPLTVGRRYHPGFHEAFSGEPALVYVDHLHMSVNVPSDYTGPVWLDDHNLEYRLWKQYARASSVPSRWFLGREASAVETYEKDRITEYSGTALPSERERSMLPQPHRGNVSVVPNGVPDSWLKYGQERRDPERSSRITLGFIGEYDWPPNREGVETFLEEVWADLRAEGDGLELVLAGKNPPDHWGTVPGVKTLGFVDSSRAFFEGIDVLVVPLTMGAGTRLKVLEAMARGVPLVGTRKAVEGIDVDPAFVAETVPAMKESLKQVLANPRRVKESVKRHQEHVREHYRWSDIGEKLYERLGEIVA